MKEKEKESAEALPLSNAQVALRLNEVADLLDAQRANEFRIRAYRTAAETVAHLKQPVHEILSEGGLEALMKLPGIGESLARTIDQLALTGRIGLLERLRGDQHAAERVFATVPSIGPETAARIHEELGIETLAELEAAAYDGRLKEVPGMGPKRIRAVRESLAGRFRRQPARAVGVVRKVENEPLVGELLDIDEEYRRKAERGKLPRIAPRRFNPTGEAWLPVLHTERDNRHYTALYSNTARAHELGTIRDWVVIYRDDRDGQGQWTAVTSHYGPLKGQRIIRGREAECAEFYGERAAPPVETVAAED